VVRQPTRMVVLDFSGTLSLSATEYGRAEHLLRKLEESGLCRFGLDSVERFWTEVVNPTWQEGSTTAKGYRQLLFEQLSRLSSSRSEKVSKAEIEACAARFVDGYFQHSTIAPQWRVVIEDIVREADALAVVASDHYAEATSHILRQLEVLGLEGVPALRALSPGQVLVANSADLGHPKASRQFWERLQRAQGIGALQVIGIVDDFGFNEQPEDAYAAAEKVRARQEQLMAVLASVFSAPVRVFPFRLEVGAVGDPLRTEAYLRLIEQARRFVRQVLAENRGPE